MKTSSVRAFMRREDYVPKKFPPGSLCREFVLQCFRCECFDVRLLSQYDEQSGDMALWLVCGRCPNRERLRVK